MALSAQVKADALAWLQAHRQGFVHTTTYHEGIKDPETGNPVYETIQVTTTEDVYGQVGEDIVVIGTQDVTRDVTRRSFIERTIKGIDPREVAYALFIWARETGVLGNATFDQVEDYVNEKLGNIMNLDRHYSKTPRTRAEIEALVGSERDL